MQIRFADDIFEYRKTLERSNFIQQLIKLTDEKEIQLTEYKETFLDIYHDRVYSIIKPQDDIFKYFKSLIYYQYTELGEIIGLYIRRQIKDFFNQNLDISRDSLFIPEWYDDTLIIELIEGIKSRGIDHTEKLREICFNNRIGRRLIDKYYCEIDWVCLVDNFKTDWSKLPIENILIEFEKQFPIKFAHLRENKNPFETYEDMIEYFKNKISKISHLPEEYIRKNMKNLSLKYIIKYNKVISQGFIEEYYNPDEHGKLQNLDNLTEEYIEKNIHSIDEEVLFKKENLSDEFIIRNFHHMDKEIFLSNARLSDNLMSRYHEIGITEYDLSSNKYLSEDFVQRNLMNFRRNLLLQNPSFNETHLREWVIRKYDWNHLSYNTSISEEILSSKVNYMNWKKITMYNSRLSPSFYKKHIDELRGNIYRLFKYNTFEVYIEVEKQKIINELY